MEGNHIHGFAVKQKNDTRIAVGIHRDGLFELLTLFGISNNKTEDILLEAAEWVNISIIRRDARHPAGFTHFVVGDLKREVVNG